MIQAKHSKGSKQVKLIALISEKLTDADLNDLV